MELVEILSFFGAMSSADLLKITKARPEDLMSELSLLLESQEVDVHITATGARYWRIPGSNQIPMSKIHRLLEIASEMQEGFTPSSLYREQCAELAIPRDRIKPIVDEWYNSGTIVAVGEKRARGIDWTVYGVKGIPVSSKKKEVLEFILNNRPLTEASLARSMGISRHSTKKIVEELIEDGDIIKHGGFLK